MRILSAQVAPQQMDKPKDNDLWHTGSSRKAITRGFAEHTSMHGVNQLAQTSSILRRAAWLAFLLAMTGLLIFSQVTLIQQYAAAESATTISIQSSNVQRMPSFTFCSLNRYKLSKLNNSRFLPSAVQDKIDQADAFSVLNLDDWELVLETLALQPPTPDEISDLEMCHSFSDLVMVAEFGEQELSEANFTTFLHPDYCLCHTFTPDKYPVVKTPGASIRSDSIYMVFNTLPDEYIPEENGVGVRLQVHHPGSLSTPQEHGVAISAGQLTWVGTQRNVINRLPAPHGSCQPGGYGQLSGLTVDECRYASIIKDVVQQCKCLNPFLEMYLIDEYRPLIENLKLCETPEDWECAYAAEDNASVAECSLNCTESYYTMSSTSTTWPATSFADAFMADFPGLLPDNAEFLRSNYAAMILYYESLNLQVTTDTKALEFASFVAQIGGEAYRVLCRLSFMVQLDHVRYLCPLSFKLVACKRQPCNVAILPTTVLCLQETLVSSSARASLPWPRSWNGWWRCA
eukprot:TRINITY_DN12308_c2_g10_i2.p1 TRINITY_DN12308_c2_g10~~TRINITY_DN12308_c2_g10_i2.p1  ORF type:complete len:516 (+),score=52.33 TRINITY_DN12308_c2_g10_i2:108-1655(+)